jgi:transposase-like protein
MKKTRFTETQIIGILKETDAGTPVKEICRSHGISDATYYNWKSKYGGMSATKPNQAVTESLLDLVSHFILPPC